MACGGLLVRGPGEAKPRPYRLLDPIPGGSTIEVAAQMGTTTKHGLARAAVLLDVMEGEQLTTERLEVRCDVQPFFLVEPRMADLGVLQPGEIKDVALTVRTRDGSRVTVKGPIKPLAGFRTRLDAVAPDQFGRASQWTLTVSSDGKRSAGVAFGWIVLTSEDALPNSTGGPSRINVSCKYSVLGPLDVSETNVSFGLILPQHVVKTKTVTLRSNHPQLDVSSILPVFEPEEGCAANWSDGVLLRVVPSDVEGEATLEIQLPKRPSTANGPFRGRIVLQSPADDVDPVVVRFSGVCRR